MTSREVWGPASPLGIAFEQYEREAAARIFRAFAVHLHGRGGVVASPFVLPTYELRRRATYGGRKGRAAIRRLKARGALPIRLETIDGSKLTRPRTLVELVDAVREVSEPGAA